VNPMNSQAVFKVVVAGFIKPFLYFDYYPNPYFVFGVFVFWFYQITYLKHFVVLWQATTRLPCCFQPTRRLAIMEFISLLLYPCNRGNFIWDYSTLLLGSCQAALIVCCNKMLCGCVFC